MTEIRKAFAHHYVGGNPSPIERLVWAYKFHRVQFLAAPHKNAWNAQSAKACISRARFDVAAGKAFFPSSGSRGDYFDGRCLWIENTESAGLRHAGYVDRFQSGYYADEYQERILRGVVYQMASRKGAMRFVPGYVNSEDDGAVIDFATSYDEFQDAARVADSMAENAAEKERDYNEAWRAGANYADLGERISDNRRAALEILAERRAARHDGARYPAMCRAISETLHGYLGAIRDARRERERMRDDVPSHLWSAFAEGAGL